MIIVQSLFIIAIARNDWRVPDPTLNIILTSLCRVETIKMPILQIR